jgi:hypothetical protein
MTGRFGTAHNQCSHLHASTPVTTSEAAFAMQQAQHGGWRISDASMRPVRFQLRIAQDLEHPADVRAWVSAKDDMKRARQRLKAFLLSHGVR